MVLGAVKPRELALIIRFVVLKGVSGLMLFIDSFDSITFPSSPILEKAASASSFLVNFFFLWVASNSSPASVASFTDITQ